MKLSRAGEYAVRAMLHLAAVEGEGVCQISTISKTWEIPESFLRKILNSLTKATLVSSSRGMGGGFTLARSAEKITLLDVIEAIEGKIYLNQCLIGPDYCKNSEWCPVHCLWRKAQDALSEIFRSKSLKELVTNPEFRDNIKITKQREENKEVIF